VLALIIIIKAYFYNIKIDKKFRKFPTMTIPNSFLAPLPGVGGLALASTRHTIKRLSEINLVIFRLTYYFLIFFSILNQIIDFKLKYFAFSL